MRLGLPVMIGLANWFSQSGATHQHASADPALETLVITDDSRGERYVQPVGCFEPHEGGWHLSVSWARGMPCKPESKARPHATAALDDIECTPERCVLPKPGATFRTVLAIDVMRAPDHETVRVHASVNVLRHEPPYLWLAIETTDRDTGITARGQLRVKLYKKTSDRVDPTSWRPDPNAEASSDPP
ncbi:MAG TPA: hypothetical protein VM261_11260 [Kofleriaceae bacterium]|nr:hypothetical protein [Kofleriaceae bacterium]